MSSLWLTIVVLVFVVSRSVCRAGKNAERTSTTQLGDDQQPRRGLKRLPVRGGRTLRAGALYTQTVHYDASAPTSPHHSTNGSGTLLPTANHHKVKEQRLATSQPPKVAKKGAAGKVYGYFTISAWTGANCTGRYAWSRLDDASAGRQAVCSRPGHCVTSHPPTPPTTHPHPTPIPIPTPHHHAKPTTHHPPTTNHHPPTPAATAASSAGRWARVCLRHTMPSSPATTYTRWPSTPTGEGPRLTSFSPYLAPLSNPPIYSMALDPNR